jgi:hypothetical protein
MAMNGLQPMPLFEPKADPTNTSARDGNSGFNVLTHI